ncbi:hypothetical protein BD770DRAFT_444534 [Pilaira anomala]|nr:hypothetical protein BD770DRAFT_444534 [Pilaira anomala]
MEIIYKISDFPDPGDRDLYNGIQEINKNNYSSALKYFEKASNYKNEYALLFLSILNFTGFGLKKRNLAKAIELLKNVASNWNNPVAEYILADIYCEGDEGISPNFAYGIHWLKLSGDKGWADSNLSLGNHYSCGEHIQKDHKKAIACFEKVAKIEKNATSIFEPPVYLFGNKNLELDFSFVTPDIIAQIDKRLKSALVSPVRWMQILKHSNDPLFVEIHLIVFWTQLTNMKSNSIALAQFCLAFMYAPNENNLHKDDKKTIYWAKKAAGYGNAPACKLVAGCYENSIGVDQDYKESIKWHKKTLILEQYSESVHHIGKLYFFGKGVKKDHKEALRYFKLMLDYNDQHAESFYHMGKVFEAGEDGAPFSYKQALECYHKAFDLNFPTAGCAIGFLYHLGLGVKKDMAKAYEWFIKTSLLDCAAGHYMLGFYYWKGHHVKKDIKKALELFLRSHEGGYERATMTIVEIMCL